MDVRLPDGTIVKNVPDGTSKADLAAKLKANGMNVPDDWIKPAAPTSLGVPISPRENADDPRVQAQHGISAPPKPQETSMWKAPMDALEAGTRAITGGLASAGGALVGAGAGATDFTEAAIRKARGMDNSKFKLHGPNEGAAAATEGNSKLMDMIFGQQSERSKSMQEAPGRALDTLGVRPESLMMIPGGIGAGAFPGAVKQAGQIARPPIGAIGGALAPAFVGAADKAMVPVRAAGKRLAADSDTLDLARKAQEQGIPLRPDMLSKNKFARMAGEASEQLPFSGSQAKVRQEAFNKALIRQIGGDEKATRLTPDVFRAAMNKSGKTIGDISEKTPVKSFQPRLQEFLKDNETQTADVRNSLAAYAREIETQTRNGVIDGTAYRRINSKLSKQMRDTSNGDLKGALSELQDLMHDELQANITNMRDLQTLQEARSMYAKGKTLEPLVGKSPDGHISPAGLMGRVTATGQGKTNMAMGRGGEMGDLARIGQRFLKEPGSSGTAERGALYGLVAGGGALTHPIATGTAVAGANLYNRLGPSLVNRILGPIDDKP